MNENRARKLAEEIRHNPKNVPFDKLDRLLRFHGYEPKQGSGGTSHYVYRKAGSAHISVPKLRPFVRECYVRDVLRLLHLEE